MKAPVSGYLNRTRRNHAIEHATVHILSERRPGLALAGRSDARGFYLYGPVSSDEVRTAVEEALRRLGAEPSLAVHPRCGTNLVVTALVSGLASLVALWTTDAQERAARPWTMLPRLLLAGTLSAVVSQPLGPAVQRRFSTRPDVGGTSVGRIVARDGGRHRLHRIELLHGATAGRGDAPGP